MYWYQFSDAENQQAREQADTQNTPEEQVGKHRKRVGNLGEIAFARFCETYLPADVWEWKNAEAMAEREPEYAETDFEIAKTSIDVKASVDLNSFRSLDWVMTRDTPSDWEVYVFIQVTNNRENAAILGWITDEDLTRAAHARQNGPDLEFFHLRNMYELFALLNVRFK